MRKIDLVVYHAFHFQSKKGRIGYVGCSKYGIEVRRNQHEKESLSHKGEHIFHRALRKYPFDQWTWIILEKGFSSVQAMKDAEVKWIELLHSRNEGYNATRGGDGVVNPSEEVRKKFSLALKGKPGLRTGAKVLESTRLKLRLAGKGKKLSAETRAKLSKVGTGRVLSEEHKKKISDTRIRKSIPSPNYGRHHAESTKEKIGAAQRGEKNHHFGKSTWITGRKHTQETREKMRLAWVKRRVSFKDK